MKHRIVKRPRPFTNEVVFFAQYEMTTGIWMDHEETASNTLDECEAKLKVLREPPVREYNE